MYKLSNVIFPTSGLCLEEELYYRVNGNARFNYLKNRCELEKNSTIFFNTYFNSFSIGKWLMHTKIDSLFLKFRFDGSLDVKIFHIAFNKVGTTLVHKEISSKTDKDVYIDIPIEELEGIIVFECYALEKTTIEEMGYFTKKQPSNSVSLGISITTFNREEALKKSIIRLKDFMKSNQELKISLQVVDNGQNISLRSDDKVKIIPNENLGGSGGFARGLYEYKENRDDITHVLFMDDDASCEGESIYRTYQLLSYAKEDTLAVAGAMLFEKAPYIQHENGANFDRTCHALKHGLNMLDINHIVDNEIEEHFDYGGWWFFAFPIKWAKEYPFPFFVRGDDINFGLHNDFSIMTLNGVVTWQGDFAYKESPLTLYLDTRSQLVLHSNAGKLDKDYCTLLFLFWKFIVKYSLKYRYASARAALLAVEDFLEGPSFWENNITMKEIFPKLAPLITQEKLEPLDIKVKCDSFIETESNHPSYHPLMRLFRAVALNGHLIPEVLFKKKGAILHKVDTPYGKIFRRKEICLYYYPKREGVILRHSKKEFFSIIKDAMVVSWRLFKKRKELIDRYHESYPYLTSKEYWQKQFKIKKDTP